MKSQMGEEAGLERPDDRAQVLPVHCVCKGLGLGLSCSPEDSATVTCLRNWTEACRAGWGWGGAKAQRRWVVVA